MRNWLKNRVKLKSQYMHSFIKNYQTLLYCLSVKKITLYWYFVSSKTFSLPLLSVDGVSCSLVARRSLDLVSGFSGVTVYYVYTLCNGSAPPSSWNSEISNEREGDILCSVTCRVATRSGAISVTSLHPSLSSSCDLGMMHVSLSSPTLIQVLHNKSNVHRECRNLFSTFLFLHF